MLQSPAREYMKLASFSIFQEIFDTVPFTPIQTDIINLMFKGYEPLEYTESQFPIKDNPETGYPNMVYLSRLRKGARLKREDMPVALNASLSKISKEIKEIYQKIERSGILDKWLEAEGTK